MLNNISLRIFSPMGFVLVAVIVLISYFTVALPIGYDQALKNSEADFKYQMSAMQGRYNNLLSSDNINAVNQDMLMTSRDEFQSIQTIMIIDENNKVAYSSDVSFVGVSVDVLPFALNRREIKRANSTGLVYYHSAEDKTKLIGYAGLKYFNASGPNNKTLVLILDTAKSAEQSLTITWTTLLVVFATLFLFGVINIIIMQFKIHDRVAVLLRMARNIAIESQTGGLRVKGKDELAQISAELESMAAAIAKREQKLQSLLTQAQEVSEKKSTFLSTMSHEIRTPLTGLIGFLELSLDKFKQHDDEKYLDISLKSAKSLLHLVNEILDLSRLENGKVAIDPCPVKAYDFFNSVLDSQRAIAKLKGLTLELDFQGDRTSIIEIDPKLMTQVILNLIGNAVKFTSQGGVTLHVLLKDPVDGQHDLLIEVIDTGIGISSENIERLFNRYEQVEEAQANTSHAGTGLGLSIVKEIARLLDLDVSVTSDFGKGSCFAVRTKVKQCSDHILNSIQLKNYIPPQLEVADIDDGSLPASVSQASYEGLVMVVDDNHINRLLISKLIAPLVNQYFTLQSGEDAVDYMKKVQQDKVTPVSMILMDINMPGMNGDEAQAAIRALSPDFESLPIVALTANSIKGAREDLLKRGMTDYLSKPIDVGELHAVFDRYMQKLQADGDKDADKSKGEASQHGDQPDKEKILSDLLESL